MTKNNLEIINVGIFGHIDHGKTTLLEKISGKWTDTHSEELKRGITIKLGYADITLYKDNDSYNIEGLGTPVKKISFVDAPGHEMLMATTLSGAALIDAAILVVAANEGVKPQTREHLMALQAKKVEKIIVVQNKIDLVDIEQAKKNYLEIKKLLGEKYKDSEVIPVSAQQSVNIDEIWRALASINPTKKNSDETPIFMVARSFDINKPGTKPLGLHGAVLGGTLKQGKLKIGDEIEIKPGRVIKSGEDKSYLPMRTKVVGLYRGSEKISEMSCGGSTSIETELDMSLAKGDLLAGNLASLEGKLPEPVKEVSLRFTLFPEVFGVSEHIKVENVKDKELLMLSINTSVTGGSVASVKNDEVKVVLKIPAIIFKGDNVGIARSIHGHWRLVGYGEII